MRNLRWPIWPFVAILGACAAPNVGTELTAFSEAVTALDTRVDTVLAARLEAEKRDAVSEAARNQDTWSLNTACEDATDPSEFGTINACAVKKERLGGTPPPVGAATAAARKVDTLVPYFQSLALLASADSEEAILASFAAFAASAGELGAAAQSQNLVEFAERAVADADNQGAAIRFVVESFRGAKLRGIVRRSHPQIVQILTEAKALLSSQELRDLAVPDFRAAHVTMLSAQSATETALISRDPVAIEAAFRNLEASTAQFKKVASTSLFAMLDQVEVTHAALLGRLAARPTADAIISFIDGLTILSNTLKGS